MEQKPIDPATMVGAAYDELDHALMHTEAMRASFGLGTIQQLEMALAWIRKALQEHSDMRERFK